MNPGLIELLAAGNDTFRRLNAGVVAGLEAQAMAKLPKPRKSKGKPTLTYAYSLPASAQLEDHRLLPSPLPQQPVCHAALGTGQGEEGYSGRVLVRITSYRKRLIDPDNLTVKYFVDCLRYAGILRDDRASDIELSTSQKKVGSKEEERTEIEVSPLT